MALPYPTPPLTDSRIRLRRWAERDIDCVRQASTDPRIHRGTTVPKKFTDDEGLAFIRRQWTRAETGVGISLAITEVDTDRAIGLVIVSPRPQDHVAGLGYWVVPSARRRGVVSSALRLVIPWAFEALGLQRLEAWVEPDNLASQRALLSVGLQHEGLLRNFLSIEGRPADAEVFALDARRPVAAGSQAPHIVRPTAPSAVPEPGTSSTNSFALPAEPRNAALMNAPTWSLRPATYDDAPLLASIVLAATKDQGLWPTDRSAADEQEWLHGFASWSRESVDGPDRLEMIEVGGTGVGRLRTERDTVSVAGEDVPRVVLCGLQLQPSQQRRGIGTSVIRQLQSEISAAGGVLDLGVEHANSGARRLYERLGFRQISQDDDEVIMRWSPSGSPDSSTTVTGP